MVNGIIYDFESTKIMLPSSMIIVCESISYSDKKDDEVITGTNNLPVGIGRGEYSGDCEIEMSQADYNLLNASAAASGGFYNMPPLPVIVSYGQTGQAITTDTLTVHFTERKKGGKKGDKSLNVTVKGAFTAPMMDNGVPAYVPLIN
ncbi:MAG: hypothetical protein LBU21_05895 [Treponema sp.]|nr:hypothetical protein [Treponema sp.]